MILLGSILESILPVAGRRNNQGRLPGGSDEFAEIWMRRSFQVKREENFPGGEH